MFGTFVNLKNKPQTINLFLNKTFYSKKKKKTYEKTHVHLYSKTTYKLLRN